ncbi:MAG: TIGR00282 family metallophosphoesterase [Alphaproteobacteria bacterium]|nr:TIGR00282 family metallophosphoesterase [Alphaproteobacteria bacterium]MDD9920532.1 TIGR00282 family metallophosphoesterase [Alphaproteobacteria bacterium]
MTFKILFLGDIAARPGRTAVQELLPNLREKLGVTAVIANGENAAGGFGISHAVAQEVYAAGVDVITLGDHTFDQKDMDIFLTQEKRIVRPINYPHGTPGRGFATYEIGGKKIGVFNVMGRVFMRDSLDCPFQASRAHMMLHKLGEHYDAMIVDAHTEATSEIAALGHIWDGQASLVVGTHTHIPTADTRIQPKGTAFQSDAGMCGYYESSLGMDFEAVIKRFERAGRFAMQPASGAGTLSGVLVEVSEEKDTKGLATAVRPIRVGGVLSQTEE